MTYPTKSIYKMITTDYLKISNVYDDDEKLYTEEDITRSMERITQINYHQEVTYNGIKFWGYNAGHVLGAAMFMVEIGGVKILYTGDFSREEDRHLLEAELPDIKPDILIIESTYGDQNHRPRKERENEFTQKVHDTVLNKGGRCLIPVFSLGRAQELLLILEEHWNNNPALSEFPIYFASSLGKKSMVVFRTYTDMMNDKIKKQLAKGNPFNFKYIRDLKNYESFEDKGPCVVIASPGMLQSGLSRQLFEKWCSDKRNTVIIPGYSVEGTLAKKIESTPSEIDAMNGQTLPLRMSVHSISFSAHSDYSQTCGFIDTLRPPNIILVHGNKIVMRKLKNKLDEKFKDEINVKMPKNGETVKYSFPKKTQCKIIGRIADQIESSTKDEEMDVEKENENGHKIRKLKEVPIKGVLVVKEFEQTLLDTRDLFDILKMSTTNVIQSLTIPMKVNNFEALKYLINSIFDDVKGPMLVDDTVSYLIFNTIKVKYKNKDELIIEWPTNPTNDMISDSLIALFSYSDNNPFLNGDVPSPKKSDEESIEMIAKILENQFLEVKILDTKEIEINVDGETAIFNFFENKIESKHDKLKKRLNTILTNIYASMLPVKLIPPSFIK